MFSHHQEWTQAPHCDRMTSTCTKCLDLILDHYGIWTTKPLLGWDFVVKTARCYSGSVATLQLQADGLCGICGFSMASPVSSQLPKVSLLLHGCKWVWVRVLCVWCPKMARGLVMDKCPTLGVFLSQTQLSRYRILLELQWMDEWMDKWTSSSTYNTKTQGINEWKLTETHDFIISLSSTETGPLHF